MREYGIAYRDQRNEIHLVGTPSGDLELMRSILRHASRDDAAVRFFVAFVDIPAWQELEQ